MPGLSVLEQELGQAAGELQASSGTPTFTWQFQQFPCTFKWIIGKYLDEGGFIEIDTLTLNVHGSDLPVSGGPEVLDRITFNAEEFRIQAIQVMPGKGLTYTCHPLAYGTGGTH